MPTSHDAQDGWPSASLYQGRDACTDLLRQALLGLTPVTTPTAMAGTAPAPWANTRQLWLADPDFTDWPLGEPAVLDALSAWLRQGGRQLRIAGLQFDATARRHPRLARWRRDWSHAIDVWTPVEGGLPPLLCGLLAAPLWLQRLDASDWRIRCNNRAEQAHTVQTQIADFLQQCESAWPVTTLGL